MTMLSLRLLLPLTVLLSRAFPVPELRSALVLTLVLTLVAALALVLVLVLALVPAIAVAAEFPSHTPTTSSADWPRPLFPSQTAPTAPTATG